MELRNVPFTPDDSHSAYETRVKDYQYLLLKDEHIILAVYNAGVAIECLFRGYIYKYTKEFDSRHNLFKLYEKSLLAQEFTLGEQSDKNAKMTAALNIVMKHWFNNLRYISENRIRRTIGMQYIRSGKKFKDINKFFKFLTNELFTATETILKIGQEKWT